LIPSTVSFEGREDKELESKLKAELPGILNWALEGLRLWHAEGLNSPTAVTSATEEYRRESDLIGQWVETCCMVDANCELHAAAGYASYKGWAETAGMKALWMNNWSRKMVERGFGKMRGSQGHSIYRGIGLLENASTGSE
jgi:putative DNA primase/helicase